MQKYPFLLIDVSSVSMKPNKIVIFVIKTIKNIKQSIPNWLKTIKKHHAALNITHELPEFITRLIKKFQFHSCPTSSQRDSRLPAYGRPNEHPTPFNASNITALSYRGSELPHMCPHYAWAIFSTLQYFLFLLRIWRHLLNPFFPTVPTFAVRETVSLA